MSNQDIVTSSPVCVYIVGRGHSGSTLLELLLNRSSTVAAIGELDQLPLQIVRDGASTRWEGKCSCGHRPFECPVWREALNILSGKIGFEITDKPFRWKVSDVGLAQEYEWSRPVQNIFHKANRATRILWQEFGSQPVALLPYIGWVNHRDDVYKTMASIRNVKAIVDASKDGIQALDLFRHSNLPVRFLYLTRDVRGNAWSAVRRNSASATEEARMWVANNRRILRIIRRIPSNLWMQIRYEDLCEDPDRCLDRVHDFIGVPRHSLTPQQEFDRRHTIAGNEIRFSLLDSVRLDRKWEEGLSIDQLTAIRKIAGSLGNDLGYRL